MSLSSDNLPRALISMSGGKDSCLSFWRARESFNITTMLTALDETGTRARSHGMSKESLIAQGTALGLQNRFISASWSDYETRFVDLLKELRSEGHTDAIFGDIDLEPHRAWEEKVCEAADLTANLPLWQEDRLKPVHEFIDTGFKAWIVCVDGEQLDENFVGRPLYHDFLNALPKGVDPCGENGEYHSFVYDGPAFSSPVKWRSLGIESYTSSAKLGAKNYHFDLLDIL